MKIRIVIPCWHRPQVSRFCFDKLRELTCDHELKVLTVISENEYIGISEEFGFDWFMTENFPVGNKINNGLKYALNFDFDYVMMMNSDSVIRPELFKYYKPFFESLNPYFGVNRVTYVNFETKEARDKVYEYSLLGVGKCIHRKVIEDTGGKLYPPRLSKSLDDQMMDNMLRLKIFPTIVNYKGQLVYDFKSEVNIHPWEKFKNLKQVCYNPV